MADLYSLLIGDDDSAEAKAKALAAALGPQRQLGLLGQLSGDRVLAPVGQGILGDVMRREQAMAQVPGQRLEQALQRQRLRASEAELTDAGAPVSDVYRQLGARLGVALPQAMTMRQAKDALGIAEKAYAAEQRAKELNLNRAAMRDAREDARTDREGKQLDAQIETLSKRLESAPAMKRDLDTLREAAAKEDIPGVGPLEGRATEAPILNWFASDEGTKVRQAAKGIIGNLIHARSGTAASEKEVDRIMKELGMGTGATEAQFRLGLERVLAQSEETMRGKEAGARPEAVREARQRGLVTSQDLRGDADPVVETRALPDGRTIVLRKSGKKELRP